MGKEISFTCYARPEPQGSMKAFMVPGLKRPVLTSANAKMKPYRQELTKVAMAAVAELTGGAGPMAVLKTPVSVIFDFYFAKPPSTPKKRIHPCVKPDLSKIIRATEDALTGIIYADDSQIVEISARKHYGTPERVEVSASIVEEKGDGKGANQDQGLFRGQEAEVLSH